MPQPEDSGGLPHPHHDGCFLLASGSLTPSPSATNLISKLYPLSGYAVTPAACRMLCVRFNCFVRQHQTADSAAAATLDTGGWLALSRPGLSPGKMRQAYLGAIANKANRRDDGRRAAPPRSVRVKRQGGTLLPHEPLSKTFTSFSGLHFSISRRRSCFQAAKKIAGDCCDPLNRSKECSLVCFRWLVEAANLSHELQGSRANLFFRHRRREIKKDLDISTHVRCSQ
jgi:hypothetical protein